MRRVVTVVAFALLGAPVSAQETSATKDTLLAPYPRAALARRNTAFHIGRVSFPVLVFCRLG